MTCSQVDGSHNKGTTTRLTVFCEDTMGNLGLYNQSGLKHSITLVQQIHFKKDIF